MIEGLKPYPAMKDSSVLCLGEVPTHWDVQPISRIGSLLKGRGGSKEDEESSGIPCVRYGDLYTRHEFFIKSSKGFVSADRASAYTPIQHGDVLFAGSGETIEDIGRSAVNLLEGKAVCGGDVILLRPNREINPRFLGYATDAPSSRHQKATMGRGFTVVHIYGSELKRLAVAIPPSDEQQAIARFLDHADRRIRRYIRAKQKLIKLLEEQKQAIIHRAVTRGLDPNVRLKPSGVEWLGDVPEHWEVAKLSHWFRTASGSTPSRGMNGYYGGHIPWVKTGELLDADIYGTQETITQDGFDASSLTMLPVNTLLIAMFGQGKTRGRTGLLKVEATVNQACLAMLPNPKRVLPEYLQLWFTSQYSFLRYISEARNATQPNLNAEIIRSQKIVAPPLVEQEQIILWVQREAKTVIAAAARAQQEIALLREYRTRLIADVVTGKLDVREAAARLPDEVEVPTPLDETDVQSDAEELDEALEEVAAEPEA